MCQLPPSPRPSMTMMIKTTLTTETPLLGNLATHLCPLTLRGNSLPLHGLNGLDTSPLRQCRCHHPDCLRPTSPTTRPLPPPAPRQLDHLLSSVPLHHHRLAHHLSSIRTRRPPPPPVLHPRALLPSRRHHHHHLRHFKKNNTLLSHFLTGLGLSLLPRSHRLRHLLAPSAVIHFCHPPSLMAPDLSGAPST